MSNPVDPRRLAGLACAHMMGIYMKKLLTSLGMAGALALGAQPALAQDLEAGVAAYDAGDYEAALAELRPLAEQGDAEAQYNLGVMYAEGQGVAQDYGEAMRLYRLAAEQGEAQAQSNLGVMYATGRGVAQDYSEAVRLYRLAAEQGRAEAQLNLGVSYATGEGVARDMVRAYMWFDLAAALGNDNGRRYRDMAARSLSPVQIAEAKRMATQCQARDYKGC